MKIETKISELGDNSSFGSLRAHVKIVWEKIFQELQLSLLAFNCKTCGLIVI